MKDQRREVIEQIESEVLIRLLLEKFPDMPDNLKKGLSLLPRESLVEHVLVALQGTTIVPFNQNGPGIPTVIYVKKVEKIVVKTLDEVLGDDEITKELCRKILQFLQGKDLGNLSDGDKQEMINLSLTAKNAFAEKYPDLSKTFNGFQMSDDLEEVLFTFRK